MQRVKNANRVVGGRLAQAVGESFQLEIDAEIEQLEAQGLAAIHRTGAATRVVGKRNGGLLDIRFVGKGPPDYLGWAHVPIAFEAKSIEEPRRWKVPDNRLHQWEWLQRARLVNPFAFAGYLLEWRRYHEVRWHPFNPQTKSLHRDEGIILSDRKLWAAYLWHLRRLGVPEPEDD